MTRQSNCGFFYFFFPDFSGILGQVNYLHKIISSFTTSSKSMAREILSWARTHMLVEELKAVTYRLNRLNN